MSRVGAIVPLQKLNVRTEHGICHLWTRRCLRAPASQLFRSGANLVPFAKAVAVRQSACQQPLIGGVHLCSGCLPKLGLLNWRSNRDWRTIPPLKEAGLSSSFSCAGFSATTSDSAQTAASHGQLEVSEDSSIADDAPYSSFNFQGANGGNPAPLQPGALYLVGTPIGNLEDISFRCFVLSPSKYIDRSFAWWR